MSAKRNDGPSQRPQQKTAARPYTTITSSPPEVTLTLATSLHSQPQLEASIDTKQKHARQQEPSLSPLIGSAPSHSKPVLSSVSPPSDSVRNVVIFGETGTGKSSLINMIAGRDIAPISNGALGCTFENVGHNVTIDGLPITLWDTAGLNEGERGVVPAHKAPQNLLDLVYNLKDGISLLVYCIRGTRFRDILVTNYELFFNLLCQEQVSIVVVVTGLEHQEPMDSWWEENKSEFDRRRMKFWGHACVTTTKGKWSHSGGYRYEEEYTESVEVVRKLVKDHLMPAPWIMDNPKVWMDEITSHLAQYSLVEEQAIAVADLTLERQCLTPLMTLLQTFHEFFHKLYNYSMNF